MENNIIILPAEWYKQAFIQLTWPHVNSDWNYVLDEVEECYTNIAEIIVSRLKLLIICKDINHVKSKFDSSLHKNISFYEVESNDTWARDHGGITVFRNNMPVICDFGFNGWGMKFPSVKDNQITFNLFEKGAFLNYNYLDCNSFILEGGSIESDGCGTILTTKKCLLSSKRNGKITIQKIEAKLSEFLGAERVLWLNNGFLAGDDTDSHIDTLARFCSVDTIAYVKCNDINDEHFSELHKMEVELKSFKQANGLPYKLIPLPMASPVFDPQDGHRLPATYANFLITNNTVLMPIYNCETDFEAVEALKIAFPESEIIQVDCSVLIRQHGSLHCITMQYPAI